MTRGFKFPRNAGMCTSLPTFCGRRGGVGRGASETANRGRTGSSVKVFGCDPNPKKKNFVS